MTKKKARTFGQDLMRGEHKVGQNRKASATDGVQTNDLRGGKTHRITNDPYRKPGDAIPSGLTHGEIPNYDGADRTITGTSIFDPVLCELSYRWFCPPGGSILDPFAGGSVRGIVASKLGRPYTGIDLRPEQIEANRVQAKAICSKPMPKWIEGDAMDVRKLTDPAKFDYLFSCPPYGDLEVYSDDPRDISTMDSGKFEESYRSILIRSAYQLKEDRFATIVIGDVRGKDGNYRNLPGLTIDAMKGAGLALYNEAILITAAGSLPIRVGKQFVATRKLGKTHQNVLTFIKGDARKATEAIGEVEFGAIDGMEDHTPSEGGKPKAGDKYGELL